MRKLHLFYANGFVPENHLKLYVCLICLCARHTHGPWNSDDGTPEGVYIFMHLQYCLLLDLE